MDWKVTEEYKDLESKAWPLFASTSRGVTVSHEQIEQATGLQRHSPQWQWLMRRIVRRALNERDIIVECINRQGYQLLTDEEAVPFVTKRYGRRIHRVAHRSNKKLKHINSAKLSIHQQRRLDASKNEFIQMRQHARKAVKTVISKTETNPRRPVGI